ncbi:kinesin-like protein, partial [Elasticomyces elasticus]
MAPSFASAAAGSNQNAASSRVEGGGEWSRRTNGTTQTFRRQSLATQMTGSNHERDASNSTNPGVYVPPHRNGTVSSARYSKDQLYDLYRQQQEAEGGLRDGLHGLYVAGWEPIIPNGASASGWNKREDGSDYAPGPDVCWDHDGTITPLGLTSLTEDEKEIFSTSVNSPLKPPTQNTAKENTPRESLSLRKISVSNNINSPGGMGVASPSVTRPGGRRRDTSESYPSPANPLSPQSITRDENKAPEVPPALQRRRTDFKEPALASKPDDAEKEISEVTAEGSHTNFNTVRRSTTGPSSAGVNPPSSPWAATPQSATFAPMGAFGNFSLGQNPGQSAIPSEKRTGLGSGRAESRFKGLMKQESSEEMGKSVRERTSRTSLSRINKPDPGWQSMWADGNSQLPDKTTEEDEEVPSGSAALGGGQDDSPLRTQPFRSFGTPGRQESRDEYGFGAFGMTSDSHGFRDMMQSRDPYQQQTPQHRGEPGPNEPMSPTDTNPYHSPEQQLPDHDDIDTDGSDIQNAHLPGLGGYGQDQQNMTPGLAGLGGLPTMGRGPGAPASDRSQTSSTGPSRGFPNLSGLSALPGLGGLSAWSAGAGASGTPNRERSGFFGGFGDGMYSSMGELQSPSLAGLGPSNPFGSVAGIGSRTGGSRLGSLFPTAMQEQMRGSEQVKHQREIDSQERTEQQQSSIHPDSFGTSEQKDLNSRGLQDMLGHLDKGGSGLRGFDGPPSSSLAPVQTPAITTASGDFGEMKLPAQPSAPMQPQPIGSSASNQPPPAQQRQMVMPDRMRWIYRDPQGMTQGPWSGLEMHDWYKAGFFSPELLVKKYEDPDYEPLAQLIRRIGNSREPFLVPQIGIPHGPPSTQAGNTWAGAGPLSAGPTSSAASQPPFPNSFPSFGTTLTADQQNALERRKQEEQYLMARQKEHLVQQQHRMIMGNPAQHSIAPQQLHHHSSAQSLHSQPSFGSIASPTTYQPSPIQGPSLASQHVPGFFDNSFRAGPVTGLGGVGAGVDMLGNIREEELPNMMDRLNLGPRRQETFGSIGQPFGSQQQQQQQDDQRIHSQQVETMLHDRSRLQQEQAQNDSLQRLGPSDQQMAQQHNERLQQFHEMRNESGVDRFGITPEGIVAQSIKPPAGEFTPQTQLATQSGLATSIPEPRIAPQEPPSLTEQVRSAASAKQTPAATPSSLWTKLDTNLPRPFPPAPSHSPLPAPA